LFSHTLPRFGIETTKVDPRDFDAFKAAIRPETRLLFAETIGNPGLEIADIACLAEIAHAAGIPLMIDSTFATPYLCRPLDHGADLVMHSATKWLGGHGVAIGGVIVDGGSFDWEASGKFPTLTEPYAGYHGLDFAEEFGPQAFSMRARAEGLRDFGACMSATTAFHLLQGIETLGPRMDRHVSNTAAVAQFLAQSEAVEWVAYPGLESHPDHALAAEMMPKGAGSVIAFGIKGGRAAGRRFIERLVVWSHLANVGDAKSLVIHPASTTHQQMDAATMAAAGLSEDLVRLSVGLEDIADLIADLEQALKAATKGA
jgi:O-acetylhomoserine (thiol)-lyase